MSTRRVDFGTPPDGFKDWTTTSVCFHGFADISRTRGEKVKSPRFSCFGHQWLLELYPGGKATSSERYVAIYLVNYSTASIKIQYGFSVRDADGKEVVNCKTQMHEFVARGSGGNARGYPEFAKRSIIMNALIDGSFIINVRMKPTQFVPTNPIKKNLLELFIQDATDVVFEVGGEHQKKGKHKRAKLSSTTLYAHRSVLQKCAPMLYEMCGLDRGEITTVSITDVKPKIFKHMIYHTYGGTLSDEDLMDNAKDIINSCDKYGLVHLKLEAEASYVKSTKITMDNMMDNLLFADSKNLALLKEAVMDFIVANKRDIMGNVSFDNVPGGTVSDVLAAVARGEQSGDGDGKDYNKMRVGTLREMLDDKGLDVDGSREAMIALLKEHSA